MTKYTIKKLKSFPKADRTWEGHVYLGMSLNNTIFQSEEALEEVLALISKKASNLVILVGDYLHRYNGQIFEGLTMEEAITDSLIKGEVLMRKIEAFFPTLNLNLKYSFKYTRDFLNHQNFTEKRDRFVRLYNEPGKFGELMDYTIDVFLRRQLKIKISVADARRLCAAYLIEEIIIFELLAEEGCTVNIYPGNQLPIIKAICTGELKNVSETLENIQAIEIKFRPV